MYCLKSKKHVKLNTLPLKKGSGFKNRIEVKTCKVEDKKFTFQRTNWIQISSSAILSCGLKKYIFKRKFFIRSFFKLKKIDIIHNPGSRSKFNVFGSRTLVGTYLVCVSSEAAPDDGIHVEGFDLVRVFRDHVAQLVPQLVVRLPLLAAK